MKKLSPEEAFTLHEQEADTIPPDALHPRRCLHCNHLFTPSRTKQLYCSRDHQRKGRNKSEKRFSPDFAQSESTQLDNFWTNTVTPDINSMRDVQRGFIAETCVIGLRSRLESYLLQLLPVSYETEIRAFLEGRQQAPNIAPLNTASPGYSIEDDPDIRAWYNLPDPKAAEGL